MLRSTGPSSYRAERAVLPSQPLEAAEGRKDKIMENLQERALKASERFLSRRGYEIVETGWSDGDCNIAIVARDNDAYVMVDVVAREAVAEGFPVVDEDRPSREIAAAAWLATHDADTEVAVRFDVVSLLVIGESKALIRHHINCLS